MPDHFDVLIIGAGVSGLGSAALLQQSRPQSTFVILEAQPGFGGTWATHRYPGIRSDSSQYSYCYSFKPWGGHDTAPGSAIQAYLGEVIADHDLACHIRYNHRVLAADWSDATRLWTLTAETPDGPTQFTTGFLWLCQGYYDHSKGFTPDWPGMADFEGPILHPQTWPDDLDTKGKRIVVIGSGSTASTMIPALAQTAAHVTMLQRSPGYFFPPPAEDPFEATLRQLGLRPDWQHEILRRKALHDADALVRRTRSDPEGTARDLIAAVAAQLPPDFDVQRHFTPRYRPWRQRIALASDGDFFAAIRAGKVSVVTDDIARFTPTGLALKSGATLDADIIVTATGFHIAVFGGIALSTNGQPVAPADTVTWRGMMFTDLPNLAWVFGYLRAAWTPRVELVAGVVLRLLTHMDQTHTAKVVPVIRPNLAALPRLPFIDPESFNAGYLARAMDRLPRRLDHPEWMHTQDYLLEKPAFDAIDLSDSGLRFS